MATEEPLARDRPLHYRADLASKAIGLGFLFKSEVDVGHALLFLENPLLRLRIPEQRNVFKEDFDDLLVVFEALYSRLAK